MSISEPFGFEEPVSSRDGSYSADTEALQLAHIEIEEALGLSDNLNQFHPDFAQYDQDGIPQMGTEVLSSEKSTTEKNRAVEDASSDNNAIMVIGGRAKPEVGVKRKIGLEEGGRGASAVHDPPSSKTTGAAATATAKAAGGDGTHSKKHPGGRSRICEFPGCTKCAQGSTKFCIKHGGRF
jgi:putative hemolysin